jgi:regulator of sirC expression with transglutaminase-like and TPR domain
VAEDFIAMVNSWQNKKADSIFAVQSQKLRQVRDDYKQGNNKIADIVKVEQTSVADIAWLIENKIIGDGEEFELAGVIKNKKANCLGCSQLFYILASSIGLSVTPINVVELQSPGPLPVGAAHVSCIVSLSDGRIVMLNPMPDGFVSAPFILENEFTKIENYWQLKDKDNPLDIYRKIQLLDKNGLIAYIYSNRGLVYASASQFDQSICDYNRAIELNPGFAEAYNNRGIAYVKSGQLSMAICDYDKSIELNPNFAEAYNNRANAYVKSGQFNQAVSDYTTAIKNNLNLAEAYGNRAITYALLKKPQQAKKDLLKAVELNPNLKGQITVLSERFNLDPQLN